jgi:hypothetical protein
VTVADVIWIGIPVAIAVVFVLTALVTQARGSREREPGSDAGPGDPSDAHEHES